MIEIFSSCNFFVKINCFHDKLRRKMDLQNNMLDKNAFLQYMKILDPVRIE